MVILSQEFIPPITFPRVVADELRAYQIAAEIQARMLNAPLIELSEGEHEITPQEYNGLFLVTVRRDPQVQETIGIVNAFSRSKHSIGRTDEAFIPSGETVLSPTSGCTCMDIKSRAEGQIKIFGRIFYANEEDLATDFPSNTIIRAER